ncbi:MAG: phage portal protein [Cupriavidus sp.]|nr:MAG: phage portal protein [Cupriavidus sp.]
MWKWLRTLGEELGFVPGRYAPGQPEPQPTAGAASPAKADSVEIAGEAFAPPQIDDVVGLLDRWARMSMQGQIPASERTLIEAAYDAAQSTFALKQHWQMSDALSADAANSFGVRKTLRERSRYETSNNSYLCGMSRTIANDVIGRGPRLQMLTGNDRINNRIEKLWKSWAKKIKLAKKLRTARETQVRDGEVFLLFYTNENLPGPVKLDVQVVECDQVEDYFFIPTPEQPVSGLELDHNGNVVKYHVLKVHPGSAVLWANNPYDFDKIEARFIIHMFKADRPGQHRGIPECTSSLSLFAILRAYTMATLDAARIAGTMNFAIGTTSNQVAPAKISNVPAFTPLQIPPGTIPLLPEGWQPFQSDMQRSVTGFGEFSDQIINEAARPVSMPRNIATGNSSNYNFSSAKMDKATYYSAVGIDQNDVGDDVLDPMLELFLEELSALGELDLLPDEDPIDPIEEMEHEWEFDTPDPIDEEKTANADKINLTTGKLALGPSDKIRMEQTARQYGLSLAQYQQLIIAQNFSAGLVAMGGVPGAGAGPVGQAAGGGQPAGASPGATPVTLPQPSSAEFATTSRLQWQRNEKAIDSLLDRLSKGEISPKRAFIMLQTMGLTPQTAQALIDDVSEQEQDPVPTGGNAATTV